MQGYRTLKGFGQAEFVERRSRFIGWAKPVQTEAEAQAFIAQIREKHWDANHHVYAYVLREGQIRRYSDDGEPQGTGGVPALEVLLREELQDLCVVITRYFGGVLLGAGGLVRAYSQGAKAGVDAAGILQMERVVEVLLEMDYSFYGKVNYLLPQFSAQVLDSDFGVAVRLKALLLERDLPAFQKQLTEQSGGQLFAQELGRYFAPFTEKEG